MELLLETDTHTPQGPGLNLKARAPARAAIALQAGHRRGPRRARGEGRSSDERETRPRAGRVSRITASYSSFHATSLSLQIKEI